MPASAPPAVLVIAPALDAGDPDAGAAPRPAPGAPAETSREPDPLAAATAGGTFARRARAVRPWELVLMEALGLGADGTAGDVPAARLLGPDDVAAAPGGAGGVDVAAAAARGRLVVADPVSLTPGRDEATLVPPEALALGPDETDALVAAANALLGDDGLALVRGASGRLYLAGLDAAALDAPPTHFLARREAGAHLPGAAAAAPWRRLMTELQMLWHALPVNEARLAHGAPPVNGLWFWGGAAPPAAPAAPAATLVADDALAVALGARAGATTLAAGGPGTDAADALDAALGRADGGRLLVVDTAPYAAWLAGDAAALEAARARCARERLAPLARAVRARRAAALVVAGGDGVEARYAPPSRRAWLARLFAPGGRS